MYEASLFYRFRQLIGGFRMDAPPVVADGDPATARFSADSELYVIVGAIAPGVVWQVEGTQADGDTPPTANPVQIGAVSDAVVTAVADNVVVHFVTDLYRRLRTIPEGASADAVADGGLNPLKMGAVADAALALLADGQTAQLVTDLYRRLYVNPQGGVADDVADDATNPVKIGAVALAPLAAVLTGVRAQLVTDLYRRLYVNPQGGVADDAADDGSNPVKMGAVADAVLTTVADGDRAQLVTDLYRRLWTVIAGYDSGSNANRTFEIAPLNLQVLEESLVDSANHAASAGISYPSDDGLVMMGYKDFSITGKFIAGADNTVTMTVEGTNDEDATPANRDWIVLYAYRTDTNAVVNSVAVAASATATFGWDFDNCNYRYIRVRLVIVNGGVLSNTVIIKIRRKAL